MYHAIVRKLQDEFGGRPPSDQLDSEIQQRLRELVPGRDLIPIWGRGRIMGVVEERVGALRQADNDG